MSLSSGGGGMRQFIGPSAVGIVFVCLHLSSTASITQLALLAAAACLLGVIPNNPYFPPWCFKMNLFTLLYKLYCTEFVGYKLLRPVLHQRHPLPHSDYRHGVRCLSGNWVGSSPFPPMVSLGTHFYKRGGGVVGLQCLGEASREGRYDGVFVVPVPVLRDNYAYFILSCKSKRCAVVDPADPALVLGMLEVVRHLTRIDFVITDILTTHKHWDHAGGNMELCDLSQGDGCRGLLAPRLNIYGSEVDRPHACNKLVKGGDVLTVAGDGAKVSVLATPGHTKGSVMFLAGDAFPKEGESQRLALFTGDCVFCGSCGALFEVSSVDELLKTVDTLNDDKTWIHPVTKKAVHTDDILMYVGHEYTQHSLNTLLSLQGTNNSTVEGQELSLSVYRDHLVDARDEARKLRCSTFADDAYTKVAGMGVEEPIHLPACTVPSTLTVERKVNVLLSLKRCVLEKLRELPPSSMLLQNTIYTSTERRETA